MSEMTKLSREAVLREALVGPEHFRRYHTSSSFKSAIDTLARMLPAWVEGLAAQSDEADARMAAAIEATMNKPIGPFLPPTQYGSYTKDLS